jgi:oxygen-dependent protoporphyrinogen oxidase
MKGKLVFLAGAAAGYVLGAQAGRKRYEQIKTGAEKLWNSPTLKKGVEQVQTFVDDHASDVPTIVGNSAKKVVDQVAKRTGKGSQNASDGQSASAGSPSPDAE